jgi:hypothetical protein
MKHLIFVWVERPADEGRGENKKWSEFSLNLEKKGAPPQGTERIGESVWLLDRKNGANYLAAILSIAESANLKASTRFFSED